MTFSKDSPPNTSTPSLGEQLRIQRRQLGQESRSSASDNAAEESDSDNAAEESDSDNAAEESDSLSSSRLRSFTAASELLRTQRQLQQESRRSALDNIDRRGSLSSIRLRSSTAAPRGTHRDSLRSILDRAIAILDDDDYEIEFEDGFTSIRSDDSNSQP
jgi:hypothetical protein